LLNKNIARYRPSLSVWALVQAVARIKVRGLLVSRTVEPIIFALQDLLLFGRSNKARSLENQAEIKL
jgi:hypothetical protein